MDIEYCMSHQMIYKGYNVNIFGSMYNLHNNNFIIDNLSI